MQLVWRGAVWPPASLTRGTRAHERASRERFQVYLYGCVDLEDLILRQHTSPRFQGRVGYMVRLHKFASSTARRGTEVRGRRLALGMNGGEDQKCYLGGLAYSSNEDSLRMYFGQFGEVPARLPLEHFLSFPSTKADLWTCAHVCCTD